MEKIAKYFQALCYWPFYGTFKFFMHFKVYGQENLHGLDNKAIIFASNHGSYIDGPIAAAMMPRRKGQFYPKNFFPIRFLALKKYFNWYYLLVSAYVWINGCVKIERGSGKELNVVLSHAIEELKKDQHLWIFPEGGFDGNPQIRPGKRGVAFLHQETGVPVIPVAIKGTHNILSFKTLLGLNRVSAKFGKPMYAISNPNLDEGVKKIMAEISDLYNSL